MSHTKNTKKKHAQPALEDLPTTSAGANSHIATDEGSKYELPEEVEATSDIAADEEPKYGLPEEVEATSDIAADEGPQFELSEEETTSVGEVTPSTRPIKDEK